MHVGYYKKGLLLGAFKGQTLGRPILGEEKHIKTLKRTDLVDFVQTHYTGPRVVIAGSGGADHQKVLIFHCLIKDH
mgnify:CR=1 FL=1